MGLVTCKECKYMGKRIGEIKGIEARHVCLRYPPKTHIVVGPNGHTDVYIGPQAIANELTDSHACGEGVKVAE